MTTQLGKAFPQLRPAFLKAGSVPSLVYTVHSLWHRRRGRLRMDAHAFLDLHRVVPMTTMPCMQRVTLKMRNSRNCGGCQPIVNLARVNGSLSPTSEWPLPWVERLSRTGRDGLLATRLQQAASAVPSAPPHQPPEHVRADGLVIGRFMRAAKPATGPGLPGSQPRCRPAPPTPLAPPAAPSLYSTSFTLSVPSDAPSNVSFDVSWAVQGSTSYAIWLNRPGNYE